MAGRQTFMLNGLMYVAKGGIPRKPLSNNALPTPVPQSGTPKTENLLSARLLEIRPPWGVGLLRGNDPHRVYTEKNMNSLFSLATPGPLQNTPTMASPPATFKINAPGFLEALGTIFMFGFGAATTDEPVWYWVGSTTTWTDAQLNADTAATAAPDISNIAGMALLGGKLYAMPRNTWADGANAKRLAQSTTLGVWTITHTDATVETFGDPALAAGDTTAYGLIAMSNGKLRSLAYDESVSGRPRIQESDTTPGAGNTWPTIGSIINVSSTPRGYVLWHDYAGAEATFISTSKVLYKGGASPVQLHTFRNSRGSYTGRLEVGKDDKLYFLDGPNIGRLTWTTSGSPIIEYAVGPHSVGDPAVQWDGLPLANQGDVTALAYSKEQEWLHIGLGGLAAAKNATWMVFEPTKPLERAWHVPYENATAQRAITAMIESNEDDGIPRLHIAEEQAAGGTQSPRHFNYVTRNPKQETAYTYATTPVFETSRMDMGLPMVKKVADKFLVVGDSIDTTEQVKAQFAKNGGTYGTSQSVTASPSGKWMGVVGTHTGVNNVATLTDSAAAFIADGVTIGDFIYNVTDGSNGKITDVTATTITVTLTGGAGNDFDTNDVYYIPKGLVGYDVQAKITLARDLTTDGAKIAAVSVAYDIIVTKDDGTPLFEYGPIIISRDKDDYPDGRNAEQILADLYTGMTKGMLAFNYQENQTAVNALVMMGPPLVVQIPQSASGSGPSAGVGDITITLQERI